MSLPPLSAYGQNEAIPSMAVLALFIKTIDSIAYFDIAIFIFLSRYTIINAVYSQNLIGTVQVKIMRKKNLYISFLLVPCCGCIKSSSLVVEQSNIVKF